MQLNVQTNYALRIVLYIAEQRRVVSSTELSAAMAIPRGLSRAIGRTLMTAGLLTARRGQTGGFALARSPDEISVADIVRAMETVCVSRCLEPDRFCSRGAADTCPVRAFFAQVQGQLDAALAGKTVASLLGDARRPFIKPPENTAQKVAIYR